MTYKTYDEVERTERGYRELLALLTALQERQSSWEARKFRVEAEAAEINAEAYRLGVPNGIHGLNRVTRAVQQDLRDLDEALGASSTPSFRMSEDGRGPHHLVQMFPADDLGLTPDSFEAAFAQLTKCIETHLGGPVTIRFHDDSDPEGK